MWPVFSPRLSQGMMGGRGLGVVYGHIKAFGLFPFPHQRSICAEGLQGWYALSMLGRTLVILKGWGNEATVCSYDIVWYCYRGAKLCVVKKKRNKDMFEVSLNAPIYTRKYM